MQSCLPPPWIPTIPSVTEVAVSKLDLPIMSAASSFVRLSTGTPKSGRFTFSF